MEQDINYTALKERGYDTNFVIISKPAKRESVKTGSQINDHFHSDMFNENTSNDMLPRMPLRMVVSHKACRDIEPQYEDNKKSKTIEYFILHPLQMMKDHNLPHSQYAKRKKVDIAKSSVRMWLQNPYVQDCSALSCYSQSTRSNVNKLKFDSYSQAPSTRIIDNNDHKKIKIATFKTAFSHNTPIVEVLKETQTSLSCEKNNQDTFDSLPIVPENTESSLTKMLSSDNFDALLKSEVTEKDTSNFTLKYSSTLALRTENIEFVWAPISSQSFNERPFNFHLIENNDK